MEQFPLTLWKLGDNAGLRKLIRHWMGASSLKYLSLIAKGNLFSLEGDRKVSVAAFLEAADLELRRSLPLVLIAFEFLMLEDFPAAKDHFFMALKRSPLDAKTMYILAKHRVLAKLLLGWDWV